MGREEGHARRRFLKSMSAGVPTALMGLVASPASGQGTPKSAPHGPNASESRRPIDREWTMAGDDAIAFRKHTLDLGAAESVTVADMNRDGRLDIVCGESWYEQLPPERGAGPRFVKHKFRAPAVPGRVLTKKVVTASEEELRRNPRARSAKLRAWEGN